MSGQDITGEQLVGENEELRRRVAALERVDAERERAEEETRRLHDIVAQEKDRLSALVNSIADEIWFADTEGRFTLTNPSASAEFGLGEADITDVRQLAASLEVLRPDGSRAPSRRRRRCASYGAKLCGIWRRSSEPPPPVSYGTARSAHPR